MSKWKILVSILAGSGLLVGILFLTPVLGGGNTPVEAADNGEFTLCAGQYYDVGSGTITDDEDSLNFHIDINAECSLGCIKVAIGDDVNDVYVISEEPDSIPVNSQGNPVIGHFPYSYPTDCNPSLLPLTGSIDFEIPFDPGDYDSPIIILLHAEDVRCGVYFGPETAWACGIADCGSCALFPGATHWVYYVEYGFN